MQKGWKKMAVWMATVCTVFAVANPVSVKAEVPDKVTTQTFEMKVGDIAYNPEWMSQVLEKSGLSELDSEFYCPSWDMKIEDESVVKVGYTTAMLEIGTREVVGPIIFIPMPSGADPDSSEFDQAYEQEFNALMQRFNLEHYLDTFTYEGRQVHYSDWGVGPLEVKGMKPGTTNIVIPAYPLKDGSGTVEVTIPVKVVGEENAQPENNQPGNTTVDTSKKDEPSSTAKSPKTGETSMAVVWGIVAIAGVMLVVCKKRETK